MCFHVGQDGILRRVGNPMPLVFPGIAQSALIVGRTPRSAADAPAGLLALCMMLTQLFQPRSFGKNEWHWVVNLRRIGNPPAALGRASVTFPESPASFAARRCAGQLAKLHST